ncbi:ArgE/DapE family deacylase [Salipiger sp. 1_MG-2023]|uniref:M20 family metallopeptidase n=1 Tax=Salipiger sp. 1_MG-2023 TaxID=3062665 RepID=UPI0026E460FA|nr:ArgE/DapE family deacylase [Salipiger sp. 1_MG-2023]MDO6588119.1 ArgE/DapE family deacylase [Salipiger sp. 1_MG-2023]
MTTLQKVWDEIDSTPDRVVNLTRDMVRIPSVNPKFETKQGLNNEADVAALLRDRLDSMGLETESWDALPGRPNVIGTLPGNEEKSLILCGHIDTVPVGNGDNWTVDPFGGEVSGGKLWGRGSVDMKAGLAACIAALESIRAAGIDLEGRVSVHAVVDEEAGGFGAMDAVAKGHLAKNAIVAEPTWDKVMPAEGGLEWVRVTLIGRSGHAGFRYNDIFPQPEVEGRLLPAINAIEIAARFLAALKEFEASRCRNNYHPLCPPGLSTINPGVIHGGVGIGEDGLPLIRTNPAMTPDRVTLDLDLKFLPHESSIKVRREFEDFVAAFAALDPWTRANPPQIAWELGGLHFPAMDTPVDHPLVQSLIGHHTSLGVAPEVCGFDAVTDAAHYAGAGVDACIYGPSGDGFHGDNEYVDLASLHKSTKVIAAAILDICGTR